MYHTPDTHYCKISFNNEEGTDRAFFELVHNSNEGFTGICKKEINITKAQCEMLECKNIKYEHLEEDLSATT